MAQASQVEGSAPRQATVLATAAPLYMAFGACLGLLQVSVPTILQREGLPLEYAGFLALLFLPFGLSGLWAPLVDRFRPFGLDRRIGWVVLCQSLVILSLLAAGLAGPRNLALLVPALVLLAFAAATMDVALDGYLAETATPESRAQRGGVKVSGMYLGMISGAALALFLFERLGWLALLACGAGVAALALAAFLTFYVPATSLSMRGTPSFRDFFVTRRMFRRVLPLMLIGLLLGLGLGAPRLLLIENGLSFAAIATIFGITSMGAGLVGALIGAEIGRRWSIRTALLLAALLFASGTLFLGFASGSLFANNLAAGFIVGCCALAYGALYGGVSGLALGWVDANQAATDYALVQSLWNLSLIGGSALAGMALVKLGTALFVIAGLGVLAGILLLIKTPSAK
jgi:PAT family beta-lactamase induction signal transducer AmpG